MSVQSNAADIAALAAVVTKIETDSENFWLIGAGILVLALQLGFMCLEIGTVRTKDTKHILVKVSFSLVHLS
jgi:ammonia channel protein AmtB